MAALDTVEKMVGAARILLQDTVETYRYPDADLLLALNAAFLEARRLRPDLFLANATEVPSYEAVDGTVVEVDQQYRMSFVYYMAGFTQLRDEEDTQDARATVFLNKFTSQLLVAAA